MMLRQRSIYDYVEKPKSNKADGNPNIKLPDDFELTQEFTDIFNLIENTNTNVYVTGDPGTGKSTFLKYFVKHTKKKAAILSSTGVGALNVGGQTIHSFFRFPPKYLQETDIVNMSTQKKKVLKKLDIIIIDEVSMVQANLMDAIDYALRLNLDRPDTPFGGVQIILIGDMCQLPPVVEYKNQPEADPMKYKTPYFFSARVFEETPVVYTELKRQYRHKDIRFVEILKKIRTKSVESEDLDALNQRVTRAVVEGNPIVLTMTNAVAGVINSEELEKLDTKAFSFEAKIDGCFYNGRAYPTDEHLVLKKGAQVMMLRNDPDHRWVNGTIAIVENLTNDSVEVLIDGNVFTVETFVWEQKEYQVNSLNNVFEQVVIGSFKQYPMKLAWAITVHKSQGQTFDTVIIVRGNGAFACGQMYVALSRCRTLDGIYLLDPIRHQDFLFDYRVNGFKEKFQEYVQNF
jgi:ATP-dependent DNA helicase PIF1